MADTKKIEHEDWLSPMNKVILQKAFKAKKTKVTLRDGRKFIIDYDVRAAHDEIFVKPEIGGGYVPRGYFKTKKVMSSLWILETTTQ